MIISDRAWDKYIKLLSRVNEKASSEMFNYLATHDWALNRNTQQQAIDYAFALSNKYGEAAAEAACEFYDIVAGEWADKVLAPAQPSKTPDYGDVAKTINGILKTSQSDKAISQAVGRLVKQTGQDTTMKNAIRDGAYFAWIPSGDTCAFCLTLASRGWQKASAKALRNGHAEHIHANCDCAYAIKFGDSDDYPGYDPEKYREMWYSAEGKNSKDKLNSIRRMKYQENKDRINAQKRENYAKHATDEKMLRLAKQGNTFVVKSEKLFANSRKIEPIEGYTDIVAHGDPYSLVFKDVKGNETNVSAKEFADILEKGGIYKGGRIRLIACQTGAENGVVPTYLAKRFNTEVLAPSEVVNVDIFGNMILADNDEDAKMGIETGKWILYNAKGRVE